jgi:hypothetical protein
VAAPLNFGLMRVIEFWFRITIFLRLVSMNFAIPVVLHSRIMRAVRIGDYQDLEQITEGQPGCLREFKLEYWSMALNSWRSNSESEDRRRIVMILMNELGDKNEKKMEMTPLICAVRYGNRQSISAILAVSNVNGLNSRGQTALILAIKYGSIETAEELLDRGADADICDENRMSAIHYACILDDLEKRERAILLLLANQADVSIMKCPYAINYDRVDIDKISRNDWWLIELNADELIVRRIKMEIDNIGLTIMSVMFLIVLASLSHQFSEAKNG